MKIAITLLVLLVGVCASTTRADEIIRQNFDGVADELLPDGASPVGRVWSWTGPTQHEYGQAKVLAGTTPDGQGKSVVLTNVAHTSTNAPVLAIDWRDTAAAGNTGSLTISYRFMVPLAGPYLSVHFFGTDWTDAAAILCVEDGQIIVQYQGEKRLEVGKYEVGKWYALRAVVNATDRTTTLWLDDKQVVERLPWQDATKAVNVVNIAASNKPVAAPDTQVLFVDDILVETPTTAGATATPVARSTPVQQAATDKADGRTFRYGVCGGPRRGQGLSDLDAVVARLDELGVDVVRRDFYWDRLQPAEGRWDWTFDDAVVNAYRAKGIDVQAVVAYTAKWATTGDPNAKNWLDWARAAPKVDAYTNFAAGLVDRYRDRMKLWEIWNEPDIDFWQGTTAQYVELFNATSKAIKQADPNAVVINGGWAMITRGRNTNFIPDFLPGASRENWDVWAFHDYMTFQQMLARAEQNRQLYDSAKLDIPIWINEGGFHTINTGGEPEQAVTLVKKLSTAPWLGVKGYFWYNLVDDGLDPHDPEHHFGLLRNDLTPKPAFFAYKNLIAQLGPRTFEKRFDAGSDADRAMWGMQYKGNRGDDNVLVLWREGKGRQTPLWIGTAAGGSVSDAVDLVGQPLSAPVLGNGKLVSLGDAPVYVHYTGDAAPQVRRLLAMPDKLPLVRGDQTPIEIEVINPSAASTTLTLSLGSTNDQLVLTPAVHEVRLPASATVRVNAMARLKDPASAAAGQVTATITGAGDSSMIAQVPFEAALVIPRRPVSERSLSLDEAKGNAVTLDTREAWVSLFDGVPKPEMQWRGPDDQSIKARWAYDDEALYLNVDVRDDKHVQPHEGSDLWKGDSLQCAVRIDDSAAGYLEFGLARTDAGATSGWIYGIAPASDLVPGAWHTALSRSVKRSGDVTRYAVRIPWTAIGATTRPANGLRLNFIANDDDGLGRKGWLQLSEGIGRTKNASLFRLFACE